MEKEKCPSLCEIIDQLTADSVVTVEGRVMENEYVKLNGMEILPDTIQVESIAEALPIARKEIPAAKKKKR